MLAYYLKLATRHFSKNLLFSFINLFGLAFGLAAAFAVLLYINEELSYEGFHQKADQIVRVNLKADFDGTEMNLATAPNQVAPFISEQLPEIEEALRVFPHNFGESASIKVEADNFVEPRMYWADPNLFEVWLQEFAYHITIQWWIFPLAGLLAVIITFITISLQSIRVAKSNPVEALKME